MEVSMRRGIGGGFSSAEMNLLCVSMRERERETSLYARVIPACKTYKNRSHYKLLELQTQEV